jgi:hypothetical protein
MRFKKVKPFKFFETLFKLCNDFNELNPDSAVALDSQTQGETLRQQSRFNCGIPG